MALSKKSIRRLLTLAYEAALERDGMDDFNFWKRCEKELLPQQKKPASGRGRRNKGLAGEREARDYLREQGFPEATRGLGQSRGGGKEAADCVQVGDLHVEVKRVELLNVHRALAQAEHDARDSKTPIVLHRRNGDKGWKVTLWADDFFMTYRDSQRLAGERED